MVSRGGWALPFFQPQLDYIYYFYGLSFILLGVLSFVLNRRTKSLLPWRWFGVFGIFNGLHEWLELLEYSFQFHPALTFLNEVLKVSALFGLIEFVWSGLPLFGLLALKRVLIRNLSLWLYATVGGVFLLAHIKEWDIVNSEILIFLSLAGGLGAAWLIFLESRRLDHPRLSLFFVSLWLGLYTLADVLIVPGNFPSFVRVIDPVAFSQVFGFPIQLVRGFMAFAMTTFLWIFYQAYRYAREDGVYEPFESSVIRNRIWILPSIFIGILGLGLVITNYLGSVHNKRFVDSYVVLTRTAARSINPYQIIHLSKRPAIPNTLGYFLLRNQLNLLVASDNDILSVNLVGRRKEGLFFLANAQSKLVDRFKYRRTEQIRPGQLYEEPPIELNQVFVSGTEQIFEIRDKFLAPIFYFVAPIHIPQTEKTIAALEIQTTAESWQRHVSFNRLIGIAASLLMFLMLAGSYFIYIRIVRAKEKIADSESHYHGLFSNMQSGFSYLKLIRGESGRVIDALHMEVNDAFERHTGLKKEEVLGKTLTGVFTDSGWLSMDWMEALDAGLVRGGTVTFEKRVEPLNRWFSISAYTPRPGFLAIVFENITERKNREEMLRKINTELEIQKQALDQFALVSETDSNRCFTYVNDMFCQTSKYSREELLGQKQNITNSGFHPESFWKRFLKTTSERKIWRGEICAKAKDGSLYWVDSTVVPVVGADGNPERFLSICVVITDRKQIEQDLYRARDTALESARLKSEFLANMSHEIRTPMNAIIGLTGMLLRSPLADEQREYVGVIKQSGELLLSIINDILDFSKMESGKVSFGRVQFDARVVIQDVIKMLQVRAQAKKIGLEYEVDEKIPPLLAGDPVHLRQILINLVNNAIKFTDKGRVDVKIELLRKTMFRTTLQFKVIDTGIGLSDEAIKSLFQPFVQIDSSSTRKFGGTGLGLAISKQLAEGMGGVIGVESQPGHGSTFWFTIPFEVAMKNEPIQAPKTSPKGWEPPNSMETQLKPNFRILLAEDNPVNQRVILRQLEKLGIRADSVANGREAVRLHFENPYDIIFMDCQMPDMDGYEATREIRKRSQSTTSPLIIALTAHALSGDREKCLNAGMDDYLAKPITIEDLEKILSRYVGSSEGAPAISYFSEQPAGPSSVVIDVQKLSNLVDHDEIELYRLIELYLNETDQSLEKLDRAVQAGVLDEVQKITHRLRGSSGSVGAETMAGVLKKMEDLANDNKSESLPDFLAQLKHEYQRVKEILSSTLPSSPQGEQENVRI